MRDATPPVTVVEVERISNEQRTADGVVHDLHVALSGPLMVDGAEQRVRADWPKQSSWPLSFESPAGASRPTVVICSVPDDRQDEAVETLRDALDRLQRP